MSEHERTNTLPETVAKILHTLLDQIEQTDRKNVARVRIDKNTHPDYWNQHDAKPRIAINTRLQDLEAQGLLRLHWQKHEKGNWLHAVDLIAEHANTLYQLLGRIPRSLLEDTFRSQLAAQEPVPGWHTDFLAALTSQVAEHRSLAPFDLATPAQNLDIFRALSAIARLEQPILERILSIHLFSNSKKLEALHPAILTVLRNVDPETSYYGDDIKAILQAHYVDTVPEHIIVSGPLELQTRAESYDLSSFYPSIAPSAATIRAAHHISTTAERVITIENTTSFSELAAMRPPSTLLLLTGGFASPAMVYLLKKIQTTHLDISFMHWGDLDADGLRILAHLRRHIPSFTPLAMDAGAFEEHLSYTQVLSTREGRLLVQLRTQQLLQDCIPLIDVLLAKGRKLEQEAIRPSWFVKRLFPAEY